MCEGDGVRRRRLVLALEADADIHVVAEATDLGSLIDVCTSLASDCVLVGASEVTPSTLAELRSRCPAVGIALVVSRRDGALAVEALRAGATGFLPAEALDEAPAVARAVASGVAALPPLVAASLLDTDPAHPAAVSNDKTRTVIGRLASGRSYREAAEAVGVDAAEAKAMVAEVVRNVQAAASTGGAPPRWGPADTSSGGAGSRGDADR